MAPVANSDAGLRSIDRKPTQEDIMLSNLMQRLDQRRAAEFEAEGSAEAGFTLMEMMVVLLILAILLAIAIPTFHGVTGSANDRSAQSNLNTALTNAKTIYQQSNQAYPTAASQLASSISTNEPSLPMTTGTSMSSANAGQVGAYTDQGTTFNPNAALIFSLAKKTNECWWVADNTAVMTTVVAAPPNVTAPWSSSAAFPTTSPYTETAPGVPVAAGIFY